MESNNYESFIADTVEAMLPCFSDPKLILFMIVDLHWTDHGYAEDGNTKVRVESSFRKKIKLIFQRPNNYTKVFLSEDDDDGFSVYMNSKKAKKPIQFKQCSDHDTCWRSDGFNWMFQSFVEAWDFFKTKNVEGREIDPMVHWSIFGGKPTYWLLDSIEPIDKEERWTTDYMIKFDKPISIQKAVNYMPKEKDEIKK